MKLPATRDSLGIFWNGEEVDGLLVYGLWHGDVIASPAIPLDDWPSSTEEKVRRLFGEGWTVWMWEIRVLGWPGPAHWVEFVTAILRAITGAGAAVSWAGLEGMFVEPPDLFRPEEMSGGVWAAMLASGEFFPPPRLDDEFRPLDDATLRRLQRVSTGVSGRGDARIIGEKRG